MSCNNAPQRTCTRSARSSRRGVPVSGNLGYPLRVPSVSLSRRSRACDQPSIVASYASSVRRWIAAVLRTAGNYRSRSLPAGQVSKNARHSRRLHRRTVEDLQHPLSSPLAINGTTYKSQSPQPKSTLSVEIGLASAQVWDVNETSFKSRASGIPLAQSQEGMMRESVRKPCPAANSSIWV